MADTISAMKKALNDSKGQIGETAFRCNRWEINDLERRMKWVDQEAVTLQANYQHKQKAVLLHWSKLFESKKEFKARINRYNEALQELLQNEDLLTLGNDPEEEAVEEIIETLENLTCKRNKIKATSKSSLSNRLPLLVQTKSKSPDDLWKQKGSIVVDRKRQITDRNVSSAKEINISSERRKSVGCETARVFERLVTHMGNPLIHPRSKISHYMLNTSQLVKAEPRDHAQPQYNNNNKGRTDKENSSGTTQKRLFHRSLISEFVDQHKYRQDELMVRNALEKVKNNMTKSHAFYQHRLKMKLPDDPMDLLKMIKADDKARAFKKKRSRCRSQLERRTTTVMVATPRPQTDSALEKTIQLPLLRQSSRPVEGQSAMPV